MFGTAIRAIIARASSIYPEQTEDNETDAVDLGQLTAITDSIIRRRRNKIEGLRAQLRRSGGGLAGCLCFPLVHTPQVVMMEGDDASEALRSPVTRLNLQQSLLMGETADA
jgi:hypothetical protein